MITDYITAAHRPKPPCICTITSTQFVFCAVMYTLGASVNDYPCCSWVVMLFSAWTSALVLVTTSWTECVPFVIILSAPWVCLHVMKNVGNHTLVSIEVGNKLNKVDLMFSSCIVFYSEFVLCVDARHQRTRHFMVGGRSLCCSHLVQ